MDRDRKYIHFRQNSGLFSKRKRPLHEASECSEDYQKQDGQIDEEDEEEEEYEEEELLDEHQQFRISILGRVTILFIF